MAHSEYAKSGLKKIRHLYLGAREEKVGLDPNDLFRCERDTLRMDQSATVKLLVRNAKSRKFLGASGRWTRKAETARNFPNLLNAVHACLAGGAKDVEVILRFKGDTNDRCFTLRVS